MSDLPKKLNQLSPEKRQLLEKMLQEQGLKLTNAEPVQEDKESLDKKMDQLRSRVEEMLKDKQLNTKHASAASQTDSKNYKIKPVIKAFYDLISQQLNHKSFASDSIFLTYGYVINDNRQYSVIDLPQYYVNKNCVKLVLELIGDCHIKGAKVLDLGCGRGGTLYTLNKFFKIDKGVGVDLSEQAIMFCKNNYKELDNLNFIEGDVEQLPLEDSSFDIITNVESSHSYPNIAKFYQEVGRILRKEGYFLYTDLLPVKEWPTCLKLLKELNFMVERDQDITANVLLSCDEIAGEHLAAFDQSKDEIIQDFLAVPGSKPYEEMRSGYSAYRICRLKKT